MKPNLEETIKLHYY